MESLYETLQRLEKSDGFYVNQNWEALEQVSSCYEQKNSYDVSSIPRDKEARKEMNEGAYKYFTAQETTGICSRLCCGENRGFNFQFQDFESKKTVIEINRKYRCCGWAVLPCCAHRVDVHAMLQGDSKGGFEVIAETSDATLAASVQTPKWHGGCLCPTYYLNDQEGKYMGKVTGYSCWWLPCCICDICGADFHVYKDDKIVGKVEKLGVANCKDVLMELHTEADKYFVEFDSSSDLNLNFKLATLATVLQIDFNFFEDKRGVKQCHCCDCYCCGYAMPCLPLCCLAACCCGTGDKKTKEGNIVENKGAVANKILDV